MFAEIELLDHQLEFVNDLKHRYLGLVGGYGCGKTKAFCVKGLQLAFLNPGFRGALLEPTNAMCVQTLIPDFEELLCEYQIPYHYRASPLPFFNVEVIGGTSQVLIRSAENYRRVAGLNLAWFGVDEADTIKKEIAWKMWRMLMSRLRVRASHIQGFTTSTPESFNFLWEFFVRDHNDDRRVIHARTYDNPFLEEDFIPSLKQNYPPQLIEAYLEGKFVNLTTGTVYLNFDRYENDTEYTLDDFDDPIHHYKHPVHIGMDFNVGKCCAIVHVIDDQQNPEIVIAVNELTGIRNTEAMIETINTKYADREINVYPDASSRAEKTNASTTDLRLLKDAGFNVHALTSNPLIKDRVNSMNAMFLNANGERRYFVNTTMCPVYTNALEQQGYVNGVPDKQHDTDHPTDSGGYFIYKRFPVKGKRSRNIRMVGI